MIANNSIVRDLPTEKNEFFREVDLAIVTFSGFFTAIYQLTI